MAKGAGIFYEPSSAGTRRDGAGSRALATLAYSLTAEVLKAHTGVPLRPAEMEQHVGWAPESSLRAAVRLLLDAGALVRHKSNGRVDGPRTEITAAGRALLPVADALERWLEQAPARPLTLETNAARGVVKALVAAWDSEMIPTLAQRPHTLAEMNVGIEVLSYPCLKRRLAKLRSAGLVEAADRRGGSTAYRVSDWLRLAVAPLAFAARWELLHSPEEPRRSPPFDLKTALLLALPAIELPAAANGFCTLAALEPGKSGSVTTRLRSVSVEVQSGRARAAERVPSSPPSTWALGTQAGWLAALAEGDTGGLRIRGVDPRLPRILVLKTHEALSGSSSAAAVSGRAGA